MSGFDELKQRIPIRGVIEKYAEVNRFGFALCPFHSEKTPSLKVYDDSFYCFGCGAGGDVIDFVALAEGLSVREAAECLNGGRKLEFVTKVTENPRKKMLDWVDYVHKTVTKLWANKYYYELKYIKTHEEAQRAADYLAMVEFVLYIEEQLRCADESGDKIKYYTDFFICYHDTIEKLRSKYLKTETPPKRQKLEWRVEK